MSSFVCLNPHCSGRRRRFVSEKSFGMHLQKSTSCWHFFRARMSAGTSSTIDTKCLIVPCLTNSAAEDANAIFVSSQRAVPLRCDFVNDNFSSSGSISYPIDDGSVYHVPCAPNVPHQSPSVPPQPVYFPFSTNQKWTVALLKLLNDMNAPDYAFKAILTWARAAIADGFSFQPEGGNTHRRNVDRLYSMMNNATQLLPSVRRVDVPHGPPCDVITFDFVPQLLQLLQNRTIMTQENLLIDVQDPLRPYTSPEGVRGEALSGQVYQDAYQRLVTNPQRQLFVPIIQWIDRTSVTGNDRFSLKPYMFTPAIFAEPFRRTIPAWGYHGFLPKPKTSSAQNQTFKLGDNIRNYHAQLQIVLSSFRTSSSRLRNVQLPLGPTGSIHVDIVTCILFVIQDMQEGDALCGRYGPHTPQVQRHCRSCNVSYADLDSPYFACRYLFAEPMAMIAASDDKAICVRWSQHAVYNAFQDVVLADHVQGIFGATPVETMHAFRKGLIEHVTFLVLENVPASRKAALDNLAIQFHQRHRQTYRRRYPATDFSRGVTNLTKVTARERLGLVFLFVILSQYDEGWDILDDTFARRSIATVKNIVEVFEALLCFDAWLMQDTFWDRSNSTNAIQSARSSIEALLKMCKNNIPAMKENCWKFPKFHELLHIVDDIERFGAPRNFNAERPESLLIYAAKRPGRRAQKRHAGIAYELQSAQRLADSHIINMVHTRIWSDNDDLDDSSDSDEANDDADTNDDDDTTESTILQTSGHATFATVTCVSCSSAPQLVWHSCTDLQRMRLPTALLKFLTEHFGLNVCIATEYVRHLYTFRCHPAYQSGGAVYDWMNVQFNDNSICPCRLAAVVVLDDNPNNSERFALVVQAAIKRSHIDSVLFTEWSWSSTYITISPNAIDSPCFVISIKDDDSKVLVTKPYDEWPAQFTTLRHYPSQNAT